MSMQNNTDRFDPILLPIIANRLQTIARETGSNLLKAGRSATISVARDFTCSIVSADGNLIASPEGLPLHVLGTLLEAQAMGEIHGEKIRPGDLYLHNDPYLGGTHHADWTIMAPVFYKGRHMFTMCTKAHQSDTGYSTPTTYDPFAKDIYEEGGVNLPCVKVQSDYEDIDDWIRMCRNRIRIPDQWYGDYRAQASAVRIGEKLLIDLIEKYSPAVIDAFVEEWLDYSERVTREAIKKLPSGTVEASGRHDPFPGIPDGIELKATVSVDGNAGSIAVDLTDNADCVPSGLNLSRSASMGQTMTAILNSLENVPVNSGTFRCFDIALRENCIVGYPRHPVSVSMATTNISDRLANMIQHALSKLGEGHGLAEGGVGMGAGEGVMSGNDARRGNRPYQDQLFLNGNGGPATATNDGWVTFVTPGGGGILYRDSIEIAEQKFPIVFESSHVVTDGGGPGTYRGAPSTQTIFGPRFGEMDVAYTVDGHETPPAGVRGGLPGGTPRTWKIATDGSTEELPPMGSVHLKAGELVGSRGCGGGGYGDPTKRDRARVVADVQRRWVSPEVAVSVYGMTAEELETSLTNGK